MAPVLIWAKMVPVSFKNKFHMNPRKTFCNTWLWPNSDLILGQKGPKIWKFLPILKDKNFLKKINSKNSNCTGLCNIVLHIQLKYRDDWLKSDVAYSNWKKVDGQATDDIPWTTEGWGGIGLAPLFQQRSLNKNASLFVMPHFSVVFISLLEICVATLLLWIAASGIYAAC